MGLPNSRGGDEGRAGGRMVGVGRDEVGVGGRDGGVGRRRSRMSWGRDRHSAKVPSGVQRT